MAKSNKIDSELKYYESIEDLVLYNFDRYMATKDNNWFIIGYSGRESKIDNEQLKKVEETILEQYFTAIDDRGFKNKLQTWAKIDNLITKYNVVSEMVKIFSNGFDLSIEGQEMRYKYIEMFKNYGFKLPLMNSISGDIEQCNIILHQLQGIKTQISLLQSTLKEDGQHQKITLQRQLQIATIALSYPYRLNPKEITVVEWIEIGKLLEEKAKQN
jgi:hypothetical protein